MLSSHNVYGYGSGPGPIQVIGYRRSVKSIFCGGWRYFAKGWLLKYLRLINNYVALCVIRESEEAPGLNRMKMKIVHFGVLWIGMESTIGIVHISTIVIVHKKFASSWGYGSLRFATDGRARQ